MKNIVKKLLITLIGFLSIPTYSYSLEIEKPIFSAKSKLIIVKKMNGQLIIYDYNGTVIASISKSHPFFPNRYKNAGILQGIFPSTNGGAQNILMQTSNGYTRINHKGETLASFPGTDSRCERGIVAKKDQSVIIFCVSVKIDEKTQTPTESGVLKVFTKEGKLVAEIETTEMTFVGEMTVSTANTVLAIPTGRSQVTIWNYKTGKVIKTLSFEHKPDKLALNASGSHLIYGEGMTRVLTYVSVKTGKTLWKSNFLGNHYLFGDLSFSLDSKHVLACSNSEAYVWTTAGKQISKITLLKKPSFEYHCAIDNQNLHFMIHSMRDLKLFSSTGKLLMKLE